MTRCGSSHAVSVLLTLVTTLILLKVGPTLAADGPIVDVARGDRPHALGSLVDHWDPERALTARLLASVKGLLNAQDPETGRFGSEPWICRDQDRIYPLAAAWSLKHEENPWYHNDELLAAIMAGGDALVDAQDKNGMWTFRKKDGSTWGQIYMPWTYSRWIRAYLLIKDAMPAERRAKWDKGLLLGFKGISKRCLNHVHNIPTHHAMALYTAGVAFDRDDWKKQAADFMQQVVAKQSPDGWWSEHVGPVVAYNFVYTDALGTYYAMSDDKRVLPALRKAAIFHANVTYPNGARVETVDERNPYKKSVALGNVGFSMTPEGRGWLLQQMKVYREQGHQGVRPDYAASFLLYGKTGKAIPPAAARDTYSWTSKDGEIVVDRRKPWFLVASGYTAKVPENRWIQDRQNVFSVYHDEAGLIIGGGNTKLQPYWSTFTVGDPGLLKHKAGDTKPTFTPPKGLIHVPAKAAVRGTDAGIALTLTYGAVTCEAEVQVVDETSADVIYRSRGPWDHPIEGHVTLLPNMKAELVSDGGATTKLTADAIDWTGETLGDWIGHDGWRLSVPTGARVLWPKLPHNPYKKAGEASLGSGRIVTVLPLSEARPESVVKLRVKP